MSQLYVMHSIAAIIGIYWIVFRIPTIIKKKREKKELKKKKLAVLGESILYLSIIYFISVVVYGYYHYDLISRALFLVGAPFYIIGAILNEYTRSVLGKQWDGPVIIIEGHKLITTGPYGIIRHPIYMANIIMYICAGLMINSIICIILSLVIFAPSLIMRALVEEKELEETFGCEYRNYKKNVPMFIPLTPLMRYLK